MPDCTAENERLRNLVHRDCALHPGANVHLFQTVHQRQSVDHRGQHAHVITGRTIHAAMGAVETAKNIPAANDHADLDAEIVNLFHLATDSFQGDGIDGIPGFTSAQDLPAQFQNDALVFDLRIDGRLLVHEGQQTAAENPRQSRGGKRRREGRMTGVESPMGQKALVPKWKRRWL
jgi:hypothetical protein